MTIKDLLQMEICIDVIDDVTDDLWIAFDGVLNLTEAGKKRWASVLGLPVTFRDGWGGTVACVMLDGRKDWEKMERKCIDFFESAAGYCAADDWDKWFFYGKTVWD